MSSVAFLGLAVGVAVSPMVHRVGHPGVRVLNLTASEVTIYSDGRAIVTLPPTSQESTRAGVTVRVLTGTRVLRAVDSTGARVDERQVRLAVGQEHLYVLGAEGICFWLERTAYGRLRDPSVERVIEPLGHGAGFWVIGPTVDTWFAPNPSSNADARSTGGQLTALRQAPCLEAPDAVRQAVHARPAFAPADE